ncbi:uncharacterized protein LOC134415521 [Melospiza melodia melodia]|uniref:uncharacterized protein LOC134415521 n=1 Tax=Melospiza melodia melodia TaxID=1914991 RepID=UPI002FD1AB42
MEGTGPGWLVPSSHKDHKMLPALTSDASKEFCNNRRGNKASQSSSFTDRNNSATQLLNAGALADESLLLGQAPQSQAAARQGEAQHIYTSGVYLLARAVAATQPIWAAGWHSPRSPERCRRGNSGSLSGRGARCGPAPGGQLSLLGGGGCAPLCGQRRAASIAARRVRVRSPGAPAASGEPAPAPLNTAGQLSPRRKQHGGAARPAFHRSGAAAAAAGALKTKRRTVTFHTVPFPPRAE